MVKIYTRTGDDGETSLLGGIRVPKSHLRIEAIGSVDEVNAALGVVRMEFPRSGIVQIGIDEALARVQHELFDIGAELANPVESAAAPASAIDEADIAATEAEIDRCEKELAPLRQFILPGGAAAAAQLHLARCICRRAERRLVELAAVEVVRGDVVRYLNRLSDLLFVMARYVNQKSGVSDVAWQAKERRGG